MKGIHISCKSQGSTAVFLAMGHCNNSASSPSSASTTALLSRSPAVDPFIARAAKKKKDRDNNGVGVGVGAFAKKNKDGPVAAVKLDDDEVKKSGEVISKERMSTSAARRSWSCTNPGDFITPPVSSRYFSGDKVFSSSRFSDSGLARTIFSEQQSSKETTTPASCDEKLPTDSPPDKVVVLRVSLHCKGCEKQMRRHISKMEGVTSFSIDFAEKKVTVRVAGDMTPAEVVSRISKVKNAQLWAGSPVPQ